MIKLSVKLFKSVIRSICLRFEGVEDCRLHDIVPAGEFLQTILLGFPIIFSFNVIIVLKNRVIYAMVRVLQ